MGKYINWLYEMILWQVSLDHNSLNTTLVSIEQIQDKL